MNFIKMTILTSLTVFLVGCNVKFFSPLAPSLASDSGLVAVDTPEGPLSWSPYLLVHSDGGAVDGYFKALTLLKSRGAVKGVRIGLSGYRDPVIQMVSSLGVEMLGVVPNEVVFSPNPEAMVDKYISIYPDVRIIQIGNEITGEGHGGITIEQYMDIFKKIYNHLRLNNSSVILMTQSTFGSGFYGANELSRMVELGLKPDILSPRLVIVGINIYTDDALNEYISTRNKYLTDSNQGGYRVWVTETGSSNPVEQIAHVKSFYPRLANALGAERTYWYALWATEPDVGFSLILNPYDSGRMTYSPLFRALAGIQ